MPVGGEPTVTHDLALVDPGSEVVEVEFRLGTMRRRLGLATLLLVLFLTFMDNTVISVTLADVQTRLHTGISQLQWVINGYALVFASFMLIFGTLGDQFGRKKIMLAGVILFCGGSVARCARPERQRPHRREGDHGPRCGGLRTGHPVDDPPPLSRAAVTGEGARDLGGRLRLGSRHGVP